MQSRHILFGFAEGQLTRKITGMLENSDINVVSTCRTTKASIKNFLMSHAEYDTAVILEMTDGDPFTAEELAEINDDRENLNIIIVVMASHKGTDYLRTLYAAGITSAILQDGNKGAKVGDIVALILNKRLRRHARHYYGIESVNFNTESAIEIRMKNCIEYIRDREHESEESIGERLMRAASTGFTVEQVEELIRRIPRDLKKKLVDTVEYKAIMGFLQSSKKTENVIPEAVVKPVFITGENPNEKKMDLEDDDMPEGDNEEEPLMIAPSDDEEPLFSDVDHVETVGLTESEDGAVSEDMNTAKVINIRSVAAMKDAEEVPLFQLDEEEEAIYMDEREDTDSFDSMDGFDFSRSKKDEIDSIDTVSEEEPDSSEGVEKEAEKPVKRSLFGFLKKKKNDKDDVAENVQEEVEEIVEGLSNTSSDADNRNDASTDVEKNSEKKENVIFGLFSGRKNDKKKNLDLSEFEIYEGGEDDEKEDFSDHKIVTPEEEKELEAKKKKRIHCILFGSVAVCGIIIIFIGFIAMNVFRGQQTAYAQEQAEQTAARGIVIENIQDLPATESTETEPTSIPWSENTEDDFVIVEPPTNQSNEEVTVISGNHVPERLEVISENRAVEVVSNNTGKRGSGESEQRRDVSESASTSTEATDPVDVLSNGQMVSDFIITNGSIAGSTLNGNDVINVINANKGSYVIVDRASGAQRTVEHGQADPVNVASESSYTVKISGSTIVFNEN